MHGYAHKSQTRERSDIPASVGREGVVPEGLIGRMDRGRQLAARFGRGLVKAMANVALDASVQFFCSDVHQVRRVVAVRSTKLEKKSSGAGHQTCRSTLWRGCTLQPPAEDASTQDLRDNRGMPTLKSVHRARVCRCGCCGVGGGGGEEQVHHVGRRSPPPSLAELASGERRAHRQFDCWRSI